MSDVLEPENGRHLVGTRSARLESANDPIDLALIDPCIANRIDACFRGQTSGRSSSRIAAEISRAKSNDRDLIAHGITATHDSPPAVARLRKTGNGAP